MHADDKAPGVERRSQARRLQGRFHARREHRIRTHEVAQQLRRPPEPAARFKRTRHHHAGRTLPTRHGLDEVASAPHLTRNRRPRRRLATSVAVLSAAVAASRVGRDPLRVSSRAAIAFGRVAHGGQGLKEAREVAVGARRASGGCPPAACELEYARGEQHVARA